MVKRLGDAVELSEAEFAELDDLKTRLPKALERVAQCIREADLTAFAKADEEAGALLRRWRELHGG